MPTWGGILKELNDLIRERNGVPGTAFDDVRRKYLALLQKHTKRNVIMYATKFTSRDPDVSPELISIIDEDIQGLMEVVHGLRGPNLDLILHSPGGSIDAAEAFVVYLRSKFKNIRVFVPQLAQSAATMIACASNEIVMGKHSHLGPTDPQILVRTSAGAMYAPAKAVVEQFEKAVQECQDLKRLAAWIPMLSQYGPHLLVHCDNASALSLELFDAQMGTNGTVGDVNLQVARQRRIKFQTDPLPVAFLLSRSRIELRHSLDLVLRQVRNFHGCSGAILPTWQ